MPVHPEEHSPPVQRQMGCVTIKSDSISFVYLDNGTDPYGVWISQPASVSKNPERKQTGHNTCFQQYPLLPQVWICQAEEFLHLPEKCWKEHDTSLLANPGRYRWWLQISNSSGQEMHRKDSSGKDHQKIHPQILTGSHIFPIQMPDPGGGIGIQFPCNVDPAI